MYKQGIHGATIHNSKRYADALTVYEAELSTLQRVGGSEDEILVVQGNLASTYQKLGRTDEALRMFREIHAARSRLLGPKHGDTLLAASNLSDLMVTSELWAEAKQLLSEQIPLALDALGPDDDETLKMRWRYALVLQDEGNHTEAVAILEDVEQRCRRVFGISHPLAVLI